VRTADEVNAVTGMLLDRLARRVAGAPPEPVRGVSRRTLLERAAGVAALMLLGNGTPEAAAAPQRCKPAFPGDSRRYASYAACIKGWAEGNYERFVDQCRRGWSRRLPDPSDWRVRTEAHVLARELECYDAAYEEWARVAALCERACPPPRRRKPPTRPSVPPPSPSPDRPPGVPPGIPPSGFDACLNCMKAGGVCCPPKAGATDGSSRGICACAAKSVPCSRYGC
jgi:hypothetical protein